jgi:hypothetical protein
MSLNYHRLFPLAAIAVLWFPQIPCSQTTEEWDILSNAQGRVVTMTRPDLKTKIGVEKEIQIDIDQDGNPIRGEIKFLNGFAREMKPRETVYYWEQFNGPHALWEYLSSVSRITAYNPKTADMPLEAYGKQSRVIIDDGREFIGKINALPQNTDWFILTFPEGSLNIYRKVIRVIQQMK